MKRAAIYCRYSTDLQNDKSVEDQIRLCAGYAERLDAEVVGEHFDRAKSGASMFGRPGLSRLMESAERGEFDILIAEAPDRISRDIADLAHIHKTLRFRGIEMNCVNGGAMDTVSIGMHGVIGQMQREEGAKKVRRGMVGVVRSGRNAGGKAYGYRPVAGQKGELEIVEEEAAIVRRIFDMYVAGIGPRIIAGALNDEGVPPPRGTRWNASTINGNDKRGYGVLRNPLYVGKLVWNRVQMVKDPMTGRRVSRVNDDSVVETMDAPHLRIITDEVFDAARRRKDAVGGVHARTAPKNKRLLSGLLKCAECGGGLSINGADRSGPRVVCSTHKESRSCSNNARYYVEKIETDVVNRLRSMFADTSVIDAFVKEYERETKRRAQERRSGRAAAEAGLADVQERIARVLDQMSRGMIDDDEIPVIMAPLRAERERLKSELSTIEPEPKVLELRPKALERFRENIENLATILTTRNGEPTHDMARIFREVVSGVIVYPRKPGEGYTYEINGWLSAVAGPELSAVLMVAEVRSDQNNRHPERTEIPLGLWQIRLGRAIRQYVEKERKISADNDALFNRPTIQTCD